MERMSYFTDAAEFGFSPEKSGTENKIALQNALDRGGTVVVGLPGVYDLSGTVFIGSYTSLIFSNGVFIRKVNDEGGFCQVILNKGALTKAYDTNIRIENLSIIVNGVDNLNYHVFGLRGQLGLFYVKDAHIKGFRCMDLGAAQYGIHICTFEDICVSDAVISGKKDGVHLGTGRRFTIRDCTFCTGDDAVALNAHDYDTGNPELGWIEDGIVENCHDLDEENRVGYFCRILAGAWRDWFFGIEVQKSDSVVSNGRLYRVRANPDGTVYTSKTPPTHEKGEAVLDGIRWVCVSDKPVYTAGVRNVTFRDIFIRKPRTAFSVHFDNDRYSRSYYPGAEIPRQEQLVFDGIRILHKNKLPLFNINTPIDSITVVNSSIQNNYVSFSSNGAMDNYYKTRINFLGCVFGNDGETELVVNSIKGKEAVIKTSQSIEAGENFRATVNAGEGNITVISDLTGLCK